MPRLPIFVVLADRGTDIEKAAGLLKLGKLVAIPTETVYGLAANALDEDAVLSIFEAKQRPHFDPLIIHVPDLGAVEKFARLKDERLIKLAKKFWPGALTLLLPKDKIVPDLVTSGLPQVAIRIPNHPLTLELLRKVSLPLAAPSANPFGYVSPTEAAHVEKQLGKKVAYILDGGNSTIGLESTIAGIEDGKLCVFRLGGLTLEEIEKEAGPVELRLNQSSDPKAPGQLKNHYAPLKPLYVGEIKKLSEKFKGKKICLITFGNDIQIPGTITFYLSKTADLKEAALNLFSMIRQADESEADVIICEKLPERGLGRAINDRLLRASVRS